MSFVRTLATLAVSYAAAKGVEKFSQRGGGAGLANSMKSAASGAAIASQVGALLTRMQVPGGADAFKENVAMLGGRARGAGGDALLGLGGLMAALGGAAWAGSGTARDMMSALSSSEPPSGMMEDNAKHLIRAMIQAARCDGEIDAGERARIMEVLGDMSAEEQAFVEAELARPVDPAALAADTGTHQRTQVYAVSAVTTRVDTPVEIAYLDRLAAELKLGAAARQRIHKAMRLPQILE
ncbi:putative membrane protein [Rhodovulum sp. P5]|uniref:tellurite resistance TerB family protein n=1 Tax=Rhodovulum sp. P5 TaxID=1564506 RepID=UPI0009C3B840|nr:DUF533 domain-containing protein [Rhodovulum sp. P5]ARE39787.1 putative membrane protein [Rhodovulum sp. P5]